MLMRPLGPRAVVLLEEEKEERPVVAVQTDGVVSQGSILESSIAVFEKGRNNE